VCVSCLYSRYSSSFFWTAVRELPDWRDSSQGSVRLNNKVKFRESGGGWTRILNPRLMVTQEVRLTGGPFLPWFVRWASRTRTRDLCPALATQVGPPITKRFFLTDLSDLSPSPMMYLYVLWGFLIIHAVLN
jgi:hypothetical protein